MYTDIQLHRLPTSDSYDISIFAFDTLTFTMYLKFLCLSEITLSLDKRMICQNFENKVSWREIIRISVVRCSSRRQALHSGTSTAAVMLSPASQE